MRKKTFPRGSHEMKASFTTMQHISSSNPSCQAELQNEEVEALKIKIQALNHFIDTINFNNEELITDYVDKFAESYELSSKHNRLHPGKAIPSFREQRKCRTKEESSRQLGSVSGCKKMKNSVQRFDTQNNALFMLQIQQKSLKCREKLLKQKIECQRLIMKRVKSHEGDNLQKDNILRVKQVNLLKQEVSQLEDIIGTKNQLEKSQHLERILQNLHNQINRNYQDYASGDIESIVDTANRLAMEVNRQRKIL